MNGQPTPLTTNRSARVTDFHTRVTRFRNLLASKWWILVLTTGVGVGTEYALIHNVPPVYTSTGQMIVSVKLNIPEGAAYSEEMHQFLGTQVALMQSKMVTDRAAARLAALAPELTPRSVSLRAAVMPNTSIFELQTSGDTAEYTQKFLQACMDEYVLLKKEMVAQASDTTLMGITKELRDLEAELSTYDKEMVAFVSSNSVLLFQDQANAGNYLSDLNHRLSTLKIEQQMTDWLEVEAQRSAPTATSSPPASPSSLVVPSVVGADPGVLTLAALKAEQQERGRSLRPDHPIMRALAVEIARREGVIQERKKALTSQIEVMQTVINEGTPQIQEINRKTAEYQKIKGKAQRIQSLYDHLLATTQTLDLNKQINPESVTIMQKTSPASPSRPDLKLKLRMAGLIGLVIGLGLLLLLDQLDDRMNSVDEITQLFEEPLLAQIPKERAWINSKNTPLLAANDQHHGMVEAFRSIRSSLLYMSESGKAPRLIMVTGSLPNEGKSVIAANLAETLAASGARVLLVDGDLRKGLLHKWIGVPSKPGLAEVLAQNVPWADTVQASTVPNLWILPQGTRTQKSGDLFMGPMTQTFLTEAAAAYDHVVLDTAPVLVADDVACLAPLTEGVVFVIRAHVSSARVSRAALNVLARRRARVLGLVFNAVQPSSGDYYYYYK